MRRKEWHVQEKAGSMGNEAREEGPARLNLEPSVLRAAPIIRWRALSRQ